MTFPDEKILDANWALFEKLTPAAAGFIGGLDLDAYRVETAESGEPALKVRRGKEWVFIDDPRDPRSEARAHVPDLPGDGYFFVVMGMGLGYLLFETAKKYPDSRFLVVEHDGRIFRRALESHDFTPYLANPRFAFAPAVRFANLTRFFYRAFSLGDNDRYLARLQLARNPRVTALSRDYYPQAAKILSQCVGHYWKIYVGEDYRDALRGLEHVLSNLSLLPKLAHIEPYRGLYAGRTGIVVSSGPSLNGQLDRLREVRDRVPIVCADSALKKLLEAGITPLGVSCVERDDINAELFKGFAIPSGTLLFAPPVVKPETYANFPGPVFTFHRHAYPFDALPPVFEPWDMGLSCSHLSYQVLGFLGCSRIALVGQDLAYDRASGLSHFDGAIPFALEQYAAKEKLLAPDNAGGQIPTTRDWLCFRDFFEDLIALNASSHKVLNVIEREKGLLIKGAERVEPREFFASLHATEKIMPSFDPEPGRRFVRERITGFNAEWRQTRTAALAELAGYRAGWRGLAASADAAAYFAARDALNKSIAPKTYVLFEGLARPHVRRFDALAASTWAVAEFRERLTGYLAFVDQILADLLRVLSAYHD